MSREVDEYRIGVEMNREIEAYEGELARLREENERLRSIFIHSMSKHHNDVFFICGEAGEKDMMGLPEKIMVCPASGLDGFAVYTKTTDYDAPSY